MFDTLILICIGYSIKCDACNLKLQKGDNHGRFGFTDDKNKRIYFQTYNLPYLLLILITQKILQNK